MQEHTHLARFRGGAAIPLTLLAQGTGTATADTGCIHHAQAAIGFPTLLVCHQELACWTTQRPIWLEGKILPREAARFPGPSDCCRSVPPTRSLPRGILWPRPESGAD